MPVMPIAHRSVVPAPLWALEVLRQRGLIRPPAVANASLPGLEVRPCRFETWLEAGGERRLRLRRPAETPLTR